MSLKSKRIILMTLYMSHTPETTKIEIKLKKVNSS